MLIIEAGDLPITVDQRIVGREAERRAHVDRAGPTSSLRRKRMDQGLPWIAWENPFSGYASPLNEQFPGSLRLFALVSEAPVISSSEGSY